MNKKKKREELCVFFKTKIGFSPGSHNAKKHFIITKTLSQKRKRMNLGGNKVDFNNNNNKISITHECGAQVLDLFGE